MHKTYKLRLGTVETVPLGRRTSVCLLKQDAGEHHTDYIDHRLYKAGGEPGGTGLRHQDFLYLKLHANNLESKERQLSF